jgi:predicted nucleic acid-binding protein
MTDYVIDTNVVMSMLISGKAHYRTILTFVKFYLPEFSLTELDEYKHVIYEKSKFTETELNEFIYFVFSSVSVIPSFALSRESIKLANNLCENIDIKDVSFLALSIDMDLPLLTRDELLFNGLKRKGYKNIVLFKDFLKQL